MKTIIVDSDELSREIMLFFVSTISMLDIVGAFNNPYDAIEYVQNHSIDLVILDVQTAGMDGIELGGSCGKLTRSLL